MRASGWGRAAAAAAAGAAVVQVAAGIPSEAMSAPAIAAVVAATAPAVVLGLLVLDQRPTSTVGALLVALGAVPMLVLAVEAWGTTATGPTTAWPGASAVAVVSAGAWAWLYLPVVWLALLFPDGHLVSRSWRPVAVASVAVPVLVQVLAVLSPETYVGDGGLAPGRPPVRLPAALEGGLGALSVLGLLAVLSAAVRSVIVRYRGAADAREQIRWFALTAPLLPVALVACAISIVLFGDVAPLGVVALGGLFVAFPATVAIAILRHDLYDIDRLISRTLAYTTLSALLTSVFAVTALVAGLALGQGSPAATGLAAVACTLSVRPLRDRLQPAVDRRFYAERGIALAAIASFVTAVRDGREEAEHVEVVLRDALRDPELQVVYRLAGSDAEARWVGVDGQPVLAPPAGGVAVGGSGQVLALAVPSRASRGRRGLVGEVLREARLPIELGRLRLQLRRALDETEASRARLVHAADDERTRLQRDLHDGAQQRLVALGLALRRAERSLDAADPSRELLGDAVEQLQAAVGELRLVAHGLRPSALDDGLEPAVRSLVRACPVPVDVVVEVGEGEVPAAVTIAAYYVAAEALANALKHAGPSSIEIRACRDGGALVLVVADDGVGGARLGGGSGLTGIADRVATVGGRLRVDSPAGAGTRVEAVLPCGS